MRWLFLLKTFFKSLSVVIHQVISGNTCRKGLYSSYVCPQLGSTILMQLSNENSDSNAKNGKANFQNQKLCPFYFSMGSVFFTSRKNVIQPEVDVSAHRTQSVDITRVTLYPSLIAHSPAHSF